jgi:hypothetical protein
MPKEFDLRLLKKAIEVVSTSLGDEEAIIQIRMGQTRPGRQVFHYYKFDIATLDRNLSAPPKNRRCAIVEINQDSPDSATVKECAWVPWDHVYGD